MANRESTCQHCLHDHKFHVSADGKSEVRCDAEVEGNLCGCVRFLKCRRARPDLEKIADGPSPASWNLLTRSRGGI